MNKNIDGKEVSSNIKEDLKKIVATFPTKPGLAVIQVGDDQASSTYVKNKKKAAEYIGINFNHYHFMDATTEDIINKIKDLNHDSTINGIIVQLPLPKDLNTELILNSINPNKDVDGLTTYNMGKLAKNEDCLAPCTPTGIIKLLDAYQINIPGSNIVIVGRSNLVGKPLSLMLLNRDATVTVCHSKTTNLSDYTSKSDILIVACGKKGLITRDMVKDNAVVIDIGINRDENGKLCGDTAYYDLLDKVKLITPVPGGVGPMTVAMLCYNVIKSYQASRQ